MLENRKIIASAFMTSFPQTEKSHLHPRRDTDAILFIHILFSEFTVLLLQVPPQPLPPPLQPPPPDR